MYEEWVNGAGVKVAEKEVEQATIDQNDKEAVRKFMTDYINVLKPAIEELKKIDLEKLTGENKEKATLALQTMEPNLGSLEAALANIDNVVPSGDEDPSGEETPSGDETPSDDETPNDEDDE